MFRRKIDILLQEKDGKTVFRVGQWMEMTEFEVLYFLKGRALLSLLFCIDLNRLGLILIGFNFHCFSCRSGSGKTASNVITDQQVPDDDDDQFVVEAAPPLPEMPGVEMVCSC